MKTMRRHKWVQGGNVPGGHSVFYNEGKPPFITPMHECNSIALRHSDVVVDIGAYVGTYAIRCARFPVKMVYAYEPTPDSCALLRQINLPNFVLRQRAVIAGNEHEVSFFESPGLGVTNSLVPSRAKKEIRVRAVNYAKVMHARKPSIVKIDIEGGEYALADMLVQPSVRAYIIDFHPVGKDWIARAEAMIARLEKAGFKAVVCPKWENGWTRAGSWERLMSTHGECEPMMTGKVCCGCGTAITASSRALCSVCWAKWKPVHREGYKRG